MNASENLRFCTELNANVPVARRGEFRPLALKNLRIDPPVVLAPMAGVTNFPFRALCREFGAGLYVSEMITARGFLNGNALTALLASSQPGESPRSIQIYGSDPKDLGLMVERLVDEGVDHVDINFGCPVRKVTSHGGGSAIPLKPRLVARLVRAMVRSADQVPVTIKMRKGIDDELSTYLEAGKVAQEEGASAVGLHARTAAQLYAGEADWDAIADLKSHVAIPVFGNGDIWEPWDALRMLRTTGCDAVIVGRGCLGRPWLFRELSDVFAGREPQAPPHLGEITAIMLDHGERLVSFFGLRMGILQMRKWTSWYTKGFRGSSALRASMMQIETLEDLRAIVAEMDAREAFPLHALRAHRGKGTRVQRVSLPEGYLDSRGDDTPPRGPNSAEELAAWEAALNAG